MATWAGAGAEGVRCRGAVVLRLGELVSVVMGIPLAG